MRIWVIGVLAICILFGLIKSLEMIKFDASVLISAAQGPLKGVTLKLLDYKVSYRDLQVKNQFWESKLGKAIFQELSLALQAVVVASKKYVDVQFEVNYFGLLRRRYKVVEHHGNFDVVAV